MTQARTASIARIDLSPEPSAAASQQRLDVSSLIDGELDDAAIERTLDALLASDDLAGFWVDAHRAGDWMRSDEVVGVGDGAAFLARLSARLADEPTVLAPRLAAGRSRRFWVRTGLPGVSVAAALVAVAWVASPLGRDGDKLVAAVPAPTMVSGVGIAPVAMKTVDVERLSDYVAAHRDVTPFGYRGAAVRPAAFTTAPSQ